MTTTTPEPGVDYPIRLGRSMLGGEPLRQHFALHVVHLPDSVAPDMPGSLKCSGDAVTARLQTGDSGTEFTGTRAKTASQKTGEYALVFHDGVVWVERLADSFANVRAKPGDCEVDPPPPPTPASGPADEWNVNAGSSPVTEEDDEFHSTLGPVGGIQKARNSPRNSPRIIPTTAGKGLATKALPATTRRRPARQSGASSSDSSASDSSSDSDSSGDDSEEFTDGSSDED